MMSQIIDGRYRVLRKLGAGGMGMVYHAVDDRLGREVAVKRLDILKNGANHKNEFIQRFEREAKTMAQFKHPNIVEVFDYGQDEDGLFLVIEYMSGGTLEKRMGEPMPAREAARILLPIANALGYVHQQGIVHRDIKPANILFDAEGNPMLTDFGIVKLTQSNESEMLTAVGTGVGTPTYMAPEQITKDFDHRVDQYALAVIFYELVTGRKPYQGATPLKTIHMHAMQALPDPRLYVPDLPQAAWELLQTALSKNPNDRYANMVFFSAALERVANGAFEDQQPDESGIDSESATMLMDVSSPPLEIPSAPLIPEEFSQPVSQPVSDAMNSFEFSPSADSSSKLVEPVEKKKKFPTLYVALGCGGLVIVALILAGVVLLAPRFLNEKNTATETPAEVVLQLTEMAVVATETEVLPTATEVFPTLTPEPEEVVVEEAVTNTPIVATATEEVVVYADGTILNRPADNMPMIYISEGSFTMGTDDSRVDQRPSHEVWLAAFWIDQYEVTNQQYAACVEAGGCMEPVSSDSETREDYFEDSAFSDYPVVHVTWGQANDYCRWVGGNLPTEAQWEKAARGTDGRVYPWGNVFADKTLLNFYNQVGDTTAVGSYLSGASPYGVMDMAGNVREWVNDWYANDYYSISPEANPMGPLSGEMRSLRGGSWQSDVNSTRAVYRNMGYPKNSSNHIGFRCIVQP